MGRGNGKRGTMEGKKGKGRKKGEEKGEGKEKGEEGRENFKPENNSFFFYFKP